MTTLDYATERARQLTREWERGATIRELQNRYGIPMRQIRQIIGEQIEEERQAIDRQREIEEKAGYLSDDALEPIRTAVRVVTGDGGSIQDAANKLKTTGDFTTDDVIGLLMTPFAKALRQYVYGREPEFTTTREARKAMRAWGMSPTSIRRVLVASEGWMI